MRILAGWFRSEDPSTVTLLLQAVETLAQHRNLVRRAAGARRARVFAEESHFRLSDIGVTPRAHGAGREGPAVSSPFPTGSMLSWAGPSSDHLFTGPSTMTERPRVWPRAMSRGMGWTGPRSPLPVSHPPPS